MNILTLVPIGGTWINPEEIAAISNDRQPPVGVIIKLKGNSLPVFIEDMTADEVVKRLQDHFTPATPEEGQVIDAMNVLKNAASDFPGFGPVQVAAGIKDVRNLLTPPTNHETTTNENSI